MTDKWIITIVNPIFWLRNKALNGFTKKETCNHDQWDMDNQIRVIKCRGCGKKAWVVEIKDLYKKHL